MSNTGKDRPWWVQNREIPPSEQRIIHSPRCEHDPAPRHVWRPVVEVEKRREKRTFIRLTDGVQMIHVPVAPEGSVNPPAGFRPVAGEWSITAFRASSYTKWVERAETVTRYERQEVDSLPCDAQEKGGKGRCGILPAVPRRLFGGPDKRWRRLRYYGPERQATRRKLADARHEWNANQEVTTEVTTSQHRHSMWTGGYWD